MITIQADNDYFLGQMGYDGVDSVEIGCDCCSDSILIMPKGKIRNIFTMRDYILIDVLCDGAIEEVLQNKGWVKAEGEYICPRCQDEEDEQREGMLDEFIRPEF